DPLQAKDDELALLTEASDLSANPGLALETVLDDTGVAARDIVLLTHPRNLNEPDVQIAAKRIQPEARLFALAVHDSGAAQLSGLRPGNPVNLNRGQVELSREPSPLPHRKIAAARSKEIGSPWRGDVEPIGFPFRLGLTGKLRPDLLAFNQEGDHLLA